MDEDEEKKDVTVDVMEDDSDSDEEDGVKFVLRDVNEMEKLLEGKKPGETIEELTAATTDAKEESADQEDGADKKEEDGEDQKFKYSHGKVKKYPTLPGLAGEINAQNYVQYASLLEKRNTPFEVDLDRMQEKPWGKFNASLDDFFNFGFNEQSWREYAARQVALRVYRLEQATMKGGSAETDVNE